MLHSCDATMFISIESREFRRIHEWHGRCCVFLSLTFALKGNNWWVEWVQSLHISKCESIWYFMPNKKQQSSFEMTLQIINENCRPCLIKMSCVRGLRLSDAHDLRCAQVHVPFPSYFISWIIFQQIHWINSVFELVEYWMLEPCLRWPFNR